MERKKLASQFNFTYRYIDDVLAINNLDFENYRRQMYPAELEIKDTSASYLDLLLSIESDGQLRTSLYDKRDDFNFHMTNFPFLSSNIPSSPAYGVLSHSSYGMLGLAPLMNALFQGRRDFHPILTHRTWLYYRFWPYYQYGGSHRTLQRVRLANKGRLLIRTAGPVPYGTCICSNVETILSWTCHVYGPFELRTSLDTIILLHSKSLSQHVRHAKKARIKNWKNKS